MKKKALKKGVNLGGWISQFKEYDHDHFRSFIQKEDILRISDWGFDHIRLPVDYMVLEDAASPGIFLQSGFDYIFSCWDWCQEAGLRVILDLHKAPGYAFDTQESNTFEDNKEMQQHFMELWKTISTKLSSISCDSMAFELLNEVHFRSSNIWNKIVQQTVRSIRSVDKERLLLFGGNYYSSVDHLKDLVILDDPRILYKFHFYLPLSVTHQKAYWVQGLHEFDQAVEYPGIAVGLEPFLEKNPLYKNRLSEDVNIQFDKMYLRKRLDAAINFSNKISQPVHCGEFGVIDRASMATRKNWTRDMVSLFNELDIGYAYWCYKAMDFGLVDDVGEINDRELINILTK